jgi:hypothetical protein
MWDKLVKYLPGFSSAVVTGTDPEGYPFSVRCMPQVDHARQVLHIRLPKDVPIQPGPAGLLWHSHNERLWNLKAFLVRGRLEQEAAGWAFHPQQFIQRGGHLLADVRAFMNARRAARQYLEKRGLPRPVIPWKAIEALRAEAKKGDKAHQ